MTRGEFIDSYAYVDPTDLTPEARGRLEAAVLEEIKAQAESARRHLEGARRTTDALTALVAKFKPTG
jgi:hypothetical protein